MPEQLAIESSDDTTFTSDLKAFFPDTAAFTDLMNIPFFGLSRSDNHQSLPYYLVIFGLRSGGGGTMNEQLSM